MSEEVKPRILYIEDDPIMGRLFKTVIENLGYIADVADCGADGIELHTLVPYDVVAVDFQLPDMTGIDVCRKLLLQDRRLPIIMVTGTGSEQLAAEALTLGVTNYVVKDHQNVYLELIPSIISQLLRKSKQEREIVKTNRASLQQSERRFKDFTNASSDWFWEMGPDLRFTSCSQGVEEAIGISPDLLIGKTRQEQGPETDDAKWIHHLAVLKAHEPFKDFEYGLIRENGTRVYVQTSGVPVFGDDGDFLGYRGTGTNITKRKLVEEERDQERRLREKLLETTQEGYWHIDPDGMTLDVNPAMCRILGRSKEEIIGKGIYDFVDAKNLGIFKTEIAVRKEGKTGAYEIALQRPDGTNIPCINNATPILDEHDIQVGSVGMWTDILERKEAEIVLRRNEANLKQSEAQFRDFAQSASDWFWETDIDHKFTYFSGRLQELTGVDTRKYLGKRRQDLATEGDDLEKFKAHSSVLDEHKPFRDFRYTVGRSKARHIKISGVPVFGPDGRFQGYRGTGSDVTNEVIATDEVQRTQGLLYNAIEVMEDGFVLFDAEDRLVICNQKYKEIYNEIADILKPGVTFAKIIQAGAECIQIFNSLEDKEAWLKDRLEQHLNPTGPFDQKLTRGDWVRVIEQKTSEGGIVGLRIDITKEKREEQELRKLSHSLEQSPSMIFITDVEGNIEYINPMFTKISGYTADEVIGKNPRILKSGDTPLDLYADLWRTIKSGLDWRGELKDRRKDGSTFWAYAIISPVKNDNGEITNFVSMHEDITLRKEIEIREHKAKEQAEIANRSKSELLANMSHELRTPLNAIIGFSETMKEETFGPVGSEKNREYLDDIHHSGMHLLELINDILDVSAIEAGALELYEENVNLAGVVEVSVRLIRPRAEAGQVIVTSSIDPIIPLIYVDERRVKQVFLNLISNAVKFTQKGGKVTVNALLNDDGSLAVAVADTGVGMDEEEVTKALTTFGQVDSGLDRKHEGTGLGLPMTKGLMDLHGGIMEIESEKGHGTTITVTFPKERVIQNVRSGSKAEKQQS